jgi:hypothetical protein
VLERLHAIVQAAEFGRWLPECRVVLYDGLPEERRVLQREFLEPGAFSVCLTHYDLAMRDRAALRKVLLSPVPMAACRAGLEHLHDVWRRFPAG